jgi:hypothetical protein
MIFINLCIMNKVFFYALKMKKAVFNCAHKI